tara:strand:+ start:4718 stop:5392 length:675 start_codon:yes stop_codon:yes gene_type:complete
MSDVTYKDVWNTLSKIDCSEHIEKKMNLSYLSWAWAWGIFVENYPEAQYRFYEDKESGIPYIQFPDGTAEVRCRVSVTDKVWREMWLPVMNHKNQAIVKPDAMAVSNAKMRCLVKCLAMLGLGHYIYAGEDTNFNAEETAPKKEEWDKPTIEEVKEEDVEDKAWASLFSEGFIKTAQIHDTKEALESYWKSNAKSLKRLEKVDNDTYKKVVEALKQKSKEINDE